jgi:hypothetical protein
MHEIAEYNRQRWAALVRANALFTRPWLDLDETSARAKLDPARTLGDAGGKNVLCLAGGGGQHVPGPVEFRQTLGRIINSLVEAGFVLAKVLEWAAEPPPRDPEPGTWDHLRLHVPPWIRFWAIHRPDLGLAGWVAKD